MTVVAPARRLLVGGALAMTFVGARATVPPVPAQLPPAGNAIAARVDAAVQAHLAAHRIPGASVGVVHLGQLVYAKGLGDATLEWHQPATPGTVYLLASLTKQFTATAVMMLAGEGRLDLDDSIVQYVDVPATWGDITIRHLLTHTAGLRDRFEAASDGRMYLDYNSRQMLDAALKTPFDAAAGEAWQYSDQGYFFLGLVIERASGQSYASFLQQRIFDPLGMTSTSLHSATGIVPQRADGYALLGNQIIGSRRRYQFGVVSHFGVQSTVSDLAKYDAALSAGSVLPTESLEEMWTPAVLHDGSPAGLAGIGYGFGWFLEKFSGHREIYHGGSTGTCLYRLPDDGTSVIVLTNLEQASGSDPCGLARTIATEYVPPLSLMAAKPLADADPELTSRLRAALEDFIAGTPDAASYTADAFPVLSAAARAQHDAFETLGPLGPFAVVADDTLAGRVVWCRGVFRARTIHFRFALDGQGRIASLQAR